MMTTDLIHTKIAIPPSRAHLVHRERLYERLDSSPECKLTLVSAPAGFGKSTLLSSWAERRDYPIAWYALDAGDNDPERFLIYLFTALHAVVPQLNLIESASALRQTQQAAAIESLLTFLANEFLKIEEPLAIVLDDYHAIDNPAVDNILSFLLERLPPVFRIFLASRQDPNFNIARLRASGQVLEITEADLRFTVEEAAQFLGESMGLQISPQDVAALEARTEGWIAGLQLAALSLEGRENTSDFIAGLRGTDRHILDYLAEEVFSRLPDLLQAFLLRISTVARFNAALCDALLDNWKETTWQDLGILGMDVKEFGSRRLIEFLDSANLFVVPLDHERQWYRFHHLFAEFLQDRMQALHPQELPALHQRASNWFSSQGFTNDAIQHALRTGDPTQAAVLIETQMKPMLHQGQTRMLVRWIEALPEAVLHEKPALQLGLAWAYILTDPLRIQSEITQILDLLRAVLKTDRATVLEDLSQQDLDPRRRNLLAQFALLLAFLGRDREPIESTIGLFQAAEGALSEDDHFTRAFARSGLASTYARMGNLELTERTFAEAAEIGRRSDSPYVYPVAKDWEATAQAQRGFLRRAADTYRQVIEQLEDIASERLPLTGHVFVGLANILLEQNDLQGALQHVSVGIARGQRMMDRDALLEGFMIQARIYQALGNGQAAREAAENGLREAELTGSRGCIDDAQAQIAMLNLAKGDESAAVRWASERGLLEGDDPECMTSLALVERMALARVLIAQGNLQRAASLLHDLLTSAESGGMGRLAIEVRCALAPILHANGDREAAEHVLAKALLVGEEEGYVRSFINEGPRMTALLRTTAASGHSPRYVKGLLKAFGAQLSAESPIEPLTERELDVLRLMSEGLSNAAIADALVVAQSTVKTHINRIYAKLGVSQRTQAILRARDLKLLR